LAQTHSDPHTLLIRLRRVPFMGITGLQTLEEAIEQMKKRGVTVMLYEANERVRARLIKTGILKLIGEPHYFKSFTEAVIHCGAKISVTTRKPEESSKNEAATLRIFASQHQ
jgi:SulP family sulfate permease